MGKHSIKRKRQKEKYRRALYEKEAEDQTKEIELEEFERKFKTRIVSPTSVTDNADSTTTKPKTHPIPLPSTVAEDEVGDTNLNLTATPSPTRRLHHRSRCLSKADSILNLDLDNSNHDSFFFTHQRVVPGDDGTLFKQAVTVSTLASLIFTVCT